MLTIKNKKYFLAGPAGKLQIPNDDEITLKLAMLAIDPYRLNSSSKRQMVRFRDDPRFKAVKVAQTFFCVDAQSNQPICFTSASSARTVAQATPELLHLTNAILNPTGSHPLLMADCEHFNCELVEQVRRETPF